MNDDLAVIEARADSLIDGHANLLRDLVELRRKHRLTQAEVAERMGVSQPTVAGFERYDANPTLSTIRRYALAVGARINESVIDDCCTVDEAMLRGIVSGGSFAPQPAPSRAMPSIAWDTTATGTRVLASR